MLDDGVRREETPSRGVVDPAPHVDEAVPDVVVVAGVALPRAAAIVVASYRLIVGVDPAAEGVVELLAQPGVLIGQLAVVIGECDGGALHIGVQIGHTACYDRAAR